MAHFSKKKEKRKKTRPEQKQRGRRKAKGEVQVHRQSWEIGIQIHSVGSLMGQHSNLSFLTSDLLSYWKFNFFFFSVFIFGCFKEQLLYKSLLFYFVPFLFFFFIQFLKTLVSVEWAKAAGKENDHQKNVGHFCLFKCMNIYLNQPFPLIVLKSVVVQL